MTDGKRLTDLLPRSMYLIDAEGQMVRWSPWFRDRIVGCSESEMASVDFLDLIHPEDRELVTRRMRTILERGVEKSIEVRVLFKGGPAYRWFFLVANRYEYDGNFFITGTGVDITRLKNAGAALTLREERFRSIFEQADSPLFITNIDGVIEYVSPAFEKISGYSASECRDKPFMQFFEEKSGDDSETVLMLSEVLANPESIQSREYAMRRRDGSVCHVEIKLQRYRDNQTEGAIGVLQDLTNCKRLESLTEFRLKLLSMVEQTSIEEILQAAIDGAERLTNCTVGCISLLSGDSMTLPKHIWSTKVRDHLKSLSHNSQEPQFDVMPFLQETIETCRVVIFNDLQASSNAPEPSTDFSITNYLCVPVIENGQVMVVFMVANKPSLYERSDARLVSTLADLVWDIVKRKMNEQSETRTQSILLQIQKMELIGQLAGGIAHDFNNMLGVILGNTELAMSSDSLDSEIEENLSEIYRAAERSAELTSQLLAFARKQTAVPNVFEVDKAIRGSLDILQRVVGKKIGFDWQPSGSDCKVRIDPSQFDQILMNLCLNASDAMSGEGSIVLKANRIKVDHTFEHPGGIRVPGEYVQISVHDSGQGIAEEHQLHIFEPFFTTKELGKGSGLGLSSVYGIVKQNRGFVDFESQEGKGTTFKVYLPLHLHRKKSDAPVSGPIDASLYDTRSTILVVEDEPEILSLCKMMLQKSGFTVLTAAFPKDAIMIAEEFSGKIDLLLTDVIMLEMNGVELASKLSTISPGFRVLFMSGYSADIIVDKGMPHNSFNLLRKPFTIKTLIEKVNAVLEAK